MKDSAIDQLVSVATSPLHPSSRSGKDKGYTLAKRSRGGERSTAFRSRKWRARGGVPAPTQTIPRVGAGPSGVKA
jgi:hypothetical protein